MPLSLQQTLAVPDHEGTWDELAVFVNKGSRLSTGQYALDMKNYHPSIV